MTASSTRSRSSARAVVLAATLALALAPPRRAAADEADDEARGLFKSGQVAFEAGEFEGALKAYSAAYALKPRPGFLFNIAQCERRLSRWHEAGANYRKYLDLSTKKTDDTVVRQLLAEVDGRAADQDAASKTAVPGTVPDGVPTEKTSEPAASEAVAADKLAADKLAADKLAARRAAEEEKAAADRSIAEKQAVDAALRQASLPLAPPRVEESSILSSGWYWAGLGVALAAGAGGTYFYLRTTQPAPTLGTIDAR